MQRLSKNIIPTHYKVYIEPLYEFKIFNGHVKINVHVFEPTNRIILHTKNLKILQIKINNNNIDTIYEDKSNDMLIIKKNISSGEHILDISYVGIINDSLFGFYKSSYMENHKLKHMYVTQFEPTGARLVFPCFDEPYFKATFQLSVKSSEDYTILSNTSIKSKKNNVTLFEKTPIMSTYLFAFAIGDFYHQQTTSKHGKLVSVYTTFGNKNKIDFALDVSLKSLEWLTDWFNIDYPINKLDLISIPDFSSGAMENFGLITFKEEAFLCDENTTISEKQQIAITISHEMAHQWFGNIVTMEWWTYLWLNESMATYFGYLVTDAIFPEWNIWLVFNDKEFVASMELDSLDNSHPIEVPIKNINHIFEIFDAISYSKGACLIKFLVGYIGYELFRKTMSNYINMYKWKCAKSDDLWNVFNDICQKDIKYIMNNWIKKPGYPVVNTYKKGDIFYLTQQKFNKSGCKKCDASWILCFDGNHIYSTKEFQIIDTENELINDNRTCFCKVYYELSYINSLHIGNFQPITKIAFIEDYFNLALSGYIEFSEVIALLKKLKNDKDYYVWKSIMRYLVKLKRLLDTQKYDEHNDENTSNAKKFNKILRSICKHYIKNSHYLLRKHTFEEIDTINLLISQLGMLYDITLVQNAISAFESDKWVKNRKSILPIIAKFGNNQHIKKLLSLYGQYDDQHIQKDIVRAIGNIRDMEYLNYIVNNILFKFGKNKNDVVLRKTHSIYLFSKLCVNPKAHKFMWLFTKNNWDKIVSIHVAESTLLYNILKYIGCAITDEKCMNEFIDFFTKKHDYNNITAIPQTIEKIKHNIKTLQIINKYLISHK